MISSSYPCSAAGSFDNARGFLRHNLILTHAGKPELATLILLTRVVTFLMVVSRYLYVLTGNQTENLQGIALLNLFHLHNLGLEELVQSGEL